MALAIALVMVLGTMSMGTLAATGDLAYDESVTITNLEAGDTVNLYKIFERNTTTGKWQLTANFDVTAIQNLQSIKDIIANKKVSLSKEDLEALATQAKKVSPDKTKVNSPATYTETVDVGMYMALVEPKTAGILYNPMVVSADYVTDDPNTNSIDASAAMMGNSTVAKKETVKVEKTANDITHDTNDYSSYAAYIIMRGLLWMAYTLAWLCLAHWKALKKRDYGIILLSTVILLFAMMERPGLDLWFNFVLLYC